MLLWLLVLVHSWSFGNDFYSQSYFPEILKRNGKIALNDHKKYDKILFYLTPKFIRFNTKKKELELLKSVLTFEIAIKNGSDVFIALANQCKWNSLFKQINWFSNRYDQKNNLDRIFLMSSQRYDVNVVMTINHQKSYKYARHNALFPTKGKLMN